MTIEDKLNEVGRAREAERAARDEASRMTAAAADKIKEADAAKQRAWRLETEARIAFATGATEATIERQPLACDIEGWCIVVDGIEVTGQDAVDLARMAKAYAEASAEAQSLRAQATKLVQPNRRPASTFDHRLPSLNGDVIL